MKGSILLESVSSIEIKACTFEGNDAGPILRQLEAQEYHGASGIQMGSSVFKFKLLECTFKNNSLADQVFQEINSQGANVTLPS